MTSTIIPTQLLMQWTVYIHLYVATTSGTVNNEDIEVQVQPHPESPGKSQGIIVWLYLN